jgi:hypothetical protein
MAEHTAPPQGASYHPDSDLDAANVPPVKALATVANVTGALVSLALLVGVGVWGYKLLVRDVSGIPVVRAASGEMRIRPEDPGGELAQHQGLSVNRVAAEGSAARPADELRLAPQPLDLLPEDHLDTAAIEQPEPLAPAQGAPSTPDIAKALEEGDVENLVAQLTAGVAPLSAEETPDAEIKAVTESVVAEVTAAETRVAAVLEGPGLRLSLRPKRRPASLAVATAAAAAAAAVAPAAASAEAKEVDPASLPAGTRLAQLGAFDSPEVAREQWQVMQQRFGTYLVGKDRVIEKATSGGRVFYRLRALGFADLGEARRFCSALVAENADCIPVVTR